MSVITNYWSLAGSFLLAWLVIMTIVYVACRQADEKRRLLQERLDEAEGRECFIECPYCGKECVAKLPASSYLRVLPKPET